MVRIEDKKKCSGCTACYSICPKKCITMVEDFEGFKYPMVDLEKCVNCGLCEKVCPMIEQATGSEYVEVYACQNKDEDVRRLSTSGGMFSALAMEILNQGGTVWAVGYDDDMCVIHKEVQKSDALVEMYGSKYVQSDLKDTFLEIRTELKEQRKVLFVGTPCQVEGLINVVSDNERKNLYAVDLLCYGVPSPKLYAEWKVKIENKYHQKIKQIYFRDKKYGYAGVNTKIVLENGKVLEDRLEVKTFLKTMFSHIGLRPSCYECTFRGRVKKCDFTLGDMWEIGQINKKMDDDKGTTGLQIHTEQGRELFEKVKSNIIACKVKEMSSDEYKKSLSQNNRKIEIPQNRENFFKDAIDLDFDLLIKKYLPTTAKEHLAIWLKPIIVKLPFSKVFFKSLKKIKIALMKH